MLIYSILYSNPLSIWNSLAPGYSKFFHEDTTIIASLFGNINKITIVFNINLWPGSDFYNPQL